MQFCVYLKLYRITDQVVKKNYKTRVVVYGDATPCLLESAEER